MTKDEALTTVGEIAHRIVGAASTSTVLGRHTLPSDTKLRHWGEQLLKAEQVLRKATR